MYVYYSASLKKRCPDSVFKKIIINNPIEIIVAPMIIKPIILFFFIDFLFFIIQKYTYSKS